MSGHFAIVKHLLSNGAKIDIKTNEGLSPLHCAIRNGHFDVMEILISSGSNINALSRNISFSKINGVQYILQQ